MAHNWKVLFPIDYRSGGDTTSQAFLKHINEIEKIYEHLNVLDMEKAGSDEIKRQINAAIDNLSLSSIKGNLDGSRITGSISNATIPSANISGSISASKISGALTNATIDGSKITGTLTNVTIPGATLGDVNASSVKGKLTNATIDASRVDGLSSYLSSNENVQNAINSIIYPVGCEIEFNHFPYTLPGTSNMIWNISAVVTVVVDGRRLYPNSKASFELAGGKGFTEDYFITQLDLKSSVVDYIFKSNNYFVWFASFKKELIDTAEPGGMETTTPGIIKRIR